MEDDVLEAAVTQGLSWWTKINIPVTQFAGDVEIVHNACFCRLRSHVVVEDCRRSGKCFTGVARCSIRTVTMCLSRAFHSEHIGAPCALALVAAPDVVLEALAVELLAFRLAAVASLDVHPWHLLLLLQPRPIAGDDLGLEGVGLLLHDALSALIHLVGVVLGVEAALAGAPLVAVEPALEAMAVALEALGLLTGAVRQIVHGGQGRRARGEKTE